MPVQKLFSSLPEDSMLRQAMNPPNWFTAASMFCGMVAILEAFGWGGEPDLYRAGLMVLFAGVFDTIDGGVARLTRTGSDFGVQLDSLVDVISFGVAPAIVLYAWSGESWGMLGLGGAFFYAIAATFRLARFNVKADGTKSAWTEGLTVTMAAAMACSAVMADAWGGLDGARPALGFMVSVGLGLLMVSPLPYRGWKTLKLRRRDLIGVAITLGLTLVIGVRYDISWAFLLANLVYTFSAPVEAGLTGRWRIQAATVLDQP